MGTKYKLIDRKTKELRASVEIVELGEGDIGLYGEDGRVLLHWPKPGYVRQIYAYAKEMAAREGFILRLEKPAPIDADDIWGRPRKIPNPLGGNPVGEYEPEDLYAPETW